MAVRRYTRDELLALSRSTLVSRPDDLPAIEQWIEYVYLEQDGKREKLRIAHSEQPQAANHERHKSNDGALGKSRQPRAGLAGAAAAEGSPMGAFSTGRPTLSSRGSMLRNASGGMYKVMAWSWEHGLIGAQTMSHLDHHGTCFPAVGHYPRRLTSKIGMLAILRLTMTRNQCAVVSSLTASPTARVQWKRKASRTKIAGAACAIEDCKESLKRTKRHSLGRIETTRRIAAMAMVTRRIRAGAEMTERMETKQQVVAGAIERQPAATEITRRENQSGWTIQS